MEHTKHVLPTKLQKSITRALINTIQYKFISISAKYNAFGYIQYKAI